MPPKTLLELIDAFLILADRVDALERQLADVDKPAIDKRREKRQARKA